MNRTCLQRNTTKRKRSHERSELNTNENSKHGDPYDLKQKITYV
jgi:hypothetical protein